MVENMPTWLRISGIAVALFLLPAYICGYHIVAWLKRRWHKRIWFR